MSDYLLMLKFDLRKAINYIVEIRRTPKKLISYFLFIAWIILVIFPGLKNKRNLAQQMTPTMFHVVMAIYAILIAFFIFATLFSALKKLSYTFSMGDVNLLFPSPLEPQRILFWSMLKKIPISFAQTVLPVLFLTPTLYNLGLRTEGIIFVYLSFVSLALLLSPMAFLAFLLSVRYQKERWVRAVLSLSVIWFIGNWFWAVKDDLTLLNVLMGYQAGGVWQFPVIGWILQIAAATFNGPSNETVLALSALILTMGLIYFAVFRLAKDYYEDVLDHAAKIEEIRQVKRNGRSLNIELFAKYQKGRKVTVQGTYLESKAFIFKQKVKYRSTGINEYFGYLSLLALIAGAFVGFIVSQKGADPSVGLFILNGSLAYILLLSSTASPISTELMLPYIYILPGTFYKKVLALHTLPIVRLALNVLLLNLSYTFMAKGDGRTWVTAFTFSLVLIAMYFELGSSALLSHVLLPSSLDRKLFYPLVIFVQILMVVIPAGLVGGILYWLSRSEWVSGLGVALTNGIVGGLVLGFSDKLFAYVEMREFGDS